jgi:amidase
MRTSSGNAAVAAVALTLTGTGLAFPSVAASFTLQDATVLSINQAFDSGVINAQKLVQLYLNRITAYDLPAGLNLNSITSLNPNALAEAAALDIERANTGARSLLHGIPILLKDNIDTSFLPTTGGFLGLKDSLPPDNATITQRLIDSGAIILGKTSLSEFAAFLSTSQPMAPGGGSVGWNSANGFTYNPYNPVPLPGSDGRPILSPGGSSTGSGVVMAANFATLAIGTDTGGSVLNPARQNSLVGIRPTVGLWSRDGIIPISATRDTAGPIARNVTDAAILLGALTGFDPKDPKTAESIGNAKSDYTPYLQLNALQGAKLGYYEKPNASTPSGAEQLSIFNQSIDLLRSLGATVSEIPFTPPTNSSTVTTYEFKRDLNLYLESLGSSATIQSIDDVSNFIENYIASDPDPANGLFRYGKDRIDTARLIDLSPSSADTLKYLEDKALDILNNRTLGIDKFMDDNDLDAIIFGDRTRLVFGAGYPAISVPAGYQTLDNLQPRDITFAAKAYEEGKLLGFAFAFEQASLVRVDPTSTPPLAGETVTSAPVPGPLPIFGVGVAFSYLRRMKKLTNQRKSFAMN